MAYVIVNDFEGGTKEQYDATTAVVHPPGDLPAGQTHHYAGPSANGWVVVAVWESKEIWEKFRDERFASGEFGPTNPARRPKPPGIFGYPPVSRQAARPAAVAGGRAKCQQPRGFLLGSA